MAAETTRITVRITTDMAKKIEQTATSEGITVSDYVRESLVAKSVTESVSKLESSMLKLVKILDAHRTSDRAVITKISDHARRSANAGKIISGWCDLMAKQLGKERDWAEVKNKIAQDIMASGDGGKNV